MTSSNVLSSYASRNSMTPQNIKMNKRSSCYVKLDPLNQRPAIGLGISSVHASAFSGGELDKGVVPDFYSDSRRSSICSSTASSSMSGSARRSSYFSDILSKSPATGVPLSTNSNRTSYRHSLSTDFDARRLPACTVSSADPIYQGRMRSFSQNTIQAAAPRKISGGIKPLQLPKRFSLEIPAASPQSKKPRSFFVVLVSYKRARQAFALLLSIMTADKASRVENNLRPLSLTDYRQDREKKSGGFPNRAVAHLLMRCLCRVWRVYFSKKSRTN